MTRLHEAAGLSLTALRICAVLAALFLVIPAQAQTEAPDWWGVRDLKTVSLLYQFDSDSTTLKPDTVVAFDNSNGTSSAQIKKQNTDWVSILRDHTGVLGLQQDITGKAQMQLGVGSLLNGNQPKQVRYQFDAFTNSTHLSTTPETSIYGTTEHTIVSVNQLRYGWVRITGMFDILGQPNQHQLTWTFNDAFFGDVAIDNLYVSAKPSANFAHVPEPGAITAIGTGMLGLLISRRKRS